jgi:pimeloyl-ACP methyl ester carboxylesterase
VLNGVLFKSRDSKGLIFYLHGNGGCISSWSDVSDVYTDLGYDLFLLDYRGYGKSEGSITSENQLHQDVQSVFNVVCTHYADKKIIVLGYSLGTCLAAKIAADNRVNMLILQAPYYSMTDMMNDHYKILPPFILRYKLDTYKYVQQCKCPIVIFHGDKDELIAYESSLKLKKLLKDTDTLVRLKGLGHNRITFDEQYVKALREILSVE